MSLYNLYRVNFDIDLVVAVEKDDLNIQTAVEDTLISHIEGIIEHELHEDSLTISKITTVGELPFDWEDHMLPYHKYKNDPDSILGYNISDILESNKAEKAKELMNEKFLLDKISKLEEQVKTLKQLLQ